jgi:hypothetical protein
MTRSRSTSINEWYRVGARALDDGVVFEVQVAGQGVILAGAGEGEQSRYASGQDDGVQAGVGVGPDDGFAQGGQAIVPDDGRGRC